MKWFWRQFAKYQQKRDKGNKPELIYAFTDTDGNRYYTWTEDDMIPVCRYQKLQNLIMHLELNLAPKQLDELVDAIQTQLHKLMTAKNDTDRAKIGAKLSAFTNEMEMRKEYCMPAEIMTEIAAVYAVRQDENANEIVERIQSEKVDQFNADINKGVDFFFRLPKLVRLMNWSEMSSDALQVYLKKSTADQLSHQRVMNHLSLEQLSKANTEATSP